MEVNKKAFGERRVGRDREFFCLFLPRYSVYSFQETNEEEVISFPVRFILNASCVPTFGSSPHNSIFLDFVLQAS